MMQIDTTIHTGTGTQSYFIQYISLILIVLTIFIGTLYRPDKKSGYEALPLNKEVASPEPVAVGNVLYSSLFNSETSELDRETALALVTMLKSHDLIAKIELFPEKNVGPQEAIATTLGRSISLQRLLLEEGVPASVFQVFSYEESAGHQANVSFYKEEELIR